ncbi:MAG: queuosine salvage family protein [Desulfobacterales bacterium]|jgi:hypothetical protein
MRLRLLDQVRAGCKTVAERAAHIRINYDLIPSYAAALLSAEAIQPEHDRASHCLDRGDDTAAFFLTLDTINFGSGYFPHMNKPPARSGYFTVAGCLNERFKKRGPFSAQELTRLTPQDCSRIFRQDFKNRPMAELMGFFARALNDLGRYVQADFDGSFTRLIKAADASAERLIRLLIRMPYFYDIALYDKIEVSFYKRAQLTAADLSLAFGGQGLGKFNDLSNLTIFADNLVPHVLRVDSILLYEEKLGSHIDAGKLVPAGSAEEIEIRACALYAVELLKKELIRFGHKLTSMELDFLLWNRGQQPAYKSIPRHRSRTVFY